MPIGKIAFWGSPLAGKDKLLYALGPLTRTGRPQRGIQSAESAQFAVPVAVYAAYKVGNKIGDAVNDFFIEQFSLDEMEERLGPGPDLLESIN